MDSRTVTASGSVQRQDVREEIKGNAVCLRMSENIDGRTRFRVPVRGF